ncbi:hypothetical protein BH11VER1_BH11VER1_04670 [soil metagenome]
MTRPDRQIDLIRVSSQDVARLCWRWLGVAVVSLFMTGNAFAVEPPLPPTPGTYFSDTAHVVSPEAASYLNQRLATFEQETSNQLVVAVYENLPEGTELNDYVNRTYKAWGIGQKGRDNGVLLMVFVKDRKMRIEVGYGLEGALPDSIAASIIRDVIGPPFKSGAYGSGLQNGVEAIISATKNEYQANAASQSNGSSSLVWLIILLVILFVIWSHTGDTVLQRAGREIFWAVLSSSSSGGSSSSSGSSSSGGFSGGGGSSGGGGASGSW